MVYLAGFAVLPGRSPASVVLGLLLVVGARAGGGMGAHARLLGVVALSCVAALTIVLQGWSGLGGGTRHVALEHWLPDGFGSLPEPAARPPEPPRQLSPPPPPPSHDLSPLPSRSASRLPSRSAHSTQPNPSHAPPSAAAVSLPNGGALASGRADCRPLQLLHWNILDGGGSRLHGIGDVVRTGGYDLVSLNELNGINLCRDTLYWPGLAEARGSLRHALALKAASGEPADRVLYHFGFCHRHQRGPPQPAGSRVGRWARLHTAAPTACTARPAQAYRRLSVAGTGQALLPNPAVA